MKKIFRKRRKEVLFTSFLLCLKVFSSILYSFVFMSTIDAIANQDKQKIISTIIIQFVIFLLEIFFYRTSQLAKARTQQKMQNDLREEISKLIARKSPQEFKEKNVGDYISWYAGDVQQIDMWYISSIFSLITCVAQVCITATAILLIDWRLLLVALTGGFLLLTFSKFFEKRIEEKAVATSTNSEEFFSEMKNVLSGFSVLKNFRKMGQFHKQTNETCQKKSEVNYQYTKVQVCSNSILMICDYSFRIVVIALCVYLIYVGKLQISAIVGVSSFLPKIIDGMTDAVAYKKTIVAAKPLLEKFDFNHNSESEGTKEEKQIEMNHSIQAKNLSFSYNKEDYILENLNFEIEIGKKYALLGPSGCGKSTLLKLLLGQLKDYTGEVYFDKEALAEISSDDINKNIAYIEQDVYLFDTTIRNNIILWGDFSEKQVENALRDSALLDDMGMFSEGLDTMCGENGKNLSGGQRQRIAVARALIFGKKILFVDESTSALDKENSKIIEEKLLSNEDLTLVLISHHLSEEQKSRFDGVISLA